jgi:cell wall-associated NlpC family hydrolase
MVEDENLNLTTMLNSNLPAIVQNTLTKLDGNFGTGVENPFNYWSGSYSEQSIQEYLNNISPLVTANNNQLADWFNTLVAQYAQGNIDLSASAMPFSKPYTAKQTASAEVKAGTAGGGSNLGSLTPISLDSPSTLATSITSPGTGAGAAQAAEIALGLQKANPSFYQYSEPQRENPASLFGPPPIKLDCSDFVTQCYKMARLPDPSHQNYNPPGTTHTIFPHCTQIPTEAEAQPGDLVFYGTTPVNKDNTEHVVIYIGGGQVITMGSQGDPSQTAYNYRADYYGFYRPDVLP